MEGELAVFLSRLEIANQEPMRLPQQCSLKWLSAPKIHTNFCFTVLIFTTLVCLSPRNCISRIQILLFSLLFKEHWLCAQLVQMCAGYQTTQVKHNAWAYQPFCINMLCAIHYAKEQEEVSVTDKKFLKRKD